MHCLSLVTTVATRWPNWTQDTVGSGCRGKRSFSVSFAGICSTLTYNSQDFIPLCFKKHRFCLSSFLVGTFKRTKTLPSTTRPANTNGIHGDWMSTCDRWANRVPIFGIGLPLPVDLTWDRVAPLDPPSPWHIDRWVTQMSDTDGKAPHLHIYKAQLPSDQNPNQDFLVGPSWSRHGIWQFATILGRVWNWVWFHS